MHGNYVSLLELGQVILLGGTTCLLIVSGLYWLVGWFQLLIRLSEAHSDEMRGLGVSVKKILYSQFTATLGIVFGIVSILLLPSLLWAIGIIFFILPAPLYVAAQPSLWNYLDQFWPYSSIDFGDPRLKDIRASLKRFEKKMLKIIVINGSIVAAIILLAFILLKI